MNESAVDLIWQEPGVVRQFRTGVCLHGHTLYSEECLSFLPRYLQAIPGVGQVLRRKEQRGQLDFGRAYWTPPLSPISAFHLERRQIVGLGLRPLVSLTDHDSIEANLSLQIAADSGQAPISVEWTVPYGLTVLHLGIHNLPPGCAREWMGRFAAYTAAPDRRLLPGILSECAKEADVLIILNHPFWLEAMCPVGGAIPERNWA